MNRAASPYKDDVEVSDYLRRMEDKSKKVGSEARPTSPDSVFGHIDTLMMQKQISSQTRTALS